MILAHQALVLGPELGHGWQVQLGHDQEVHRGPGVDVVEGVQVVVFIDLAAGNLAGDDFAKQAVGVVAHGACVQWGA